jgi:thiamine-phosphate pyrophosphorylase
VVEQRRVPRLHVIVNASPGWPGCDLVEAVAAAGAPLVQVRTKAGTDRERLTIARACIDRAAPHGALVVINDRADIGVAADADGVHGGLDDLPIAGLRTVVGSGRLVGGTARDPETARAHEAAGADYLGVGPVYPTTSKDGLPDPIGLAMVTRVAAAVRIPVIAIAGITVHRVAEVLAAGAHGVAVMGAIASADDPSAATKRFLDALGSS